MHGRYRKSGSGGGEGLGGREGIEERNRNGRGKNWGESER
jgi:hypothetical protein